MPQMLQVQIPHTAFRRQSSVVLFCRAFQDGTDQGQLAKDGTKNCIQCVEDARRITGITEDMERDERKSEVLDGRGCRGCHWCRCRCHRCQSRSRDSPRLRNLKMLEKRKLKVGGKSGSRSNVEKRRRWPLFQKLFQALRSGIVFQMLIAHDAHAHVAHASSCSTLYSQCSTGTSCSYLKPRSCTRSRCLQ